MAQEIDINLNVNAEQADKSLGTLKQQLKAAKAEVIALSDEFGITSQQAIKAAERAAELGHEISAANKLVKTFNPSATLNSTTIALGSVKEGFEVANHTMKSFGVESNQLEGALGKVGVAMELTSGITSIQESAGAFKNLAATVKSYSIVQKLITAGQWLWNAAMAANPIGAIVAVVAALVAAGYALVKMFIASSDAAHKAEEANKALNKELETQVKNQKAASQEADLARDLQLGMAKASGKSAAEVRKLAVELANQEVQQKLANAQTLRAIAIEAIRVAGLEDATDAQKETAKKALKEFNEANDNLKASVLNRKKLLNANKIEERQEQTDANTKAVKKEKEHQEELKKARKKAQKEHIEQLQEFAKQLRDIQIKEGYKAQDDIETATKANADRLLSAQDLAIKNENDAYKIKYDNAVKAGYDIQELEKDHQFKLKEIKDGFDLKQKEEKLLGIQLELDNDAVSFETKKQLILDREAILLADKTLTENERKKIHKDTEDAIAAEDIEREQKKSAAIQSFKENLNNIISGIEASGLAKSKAGQALSKTLALTQIGIDTAVAIGNASKLATAEGAKAAAVGGPGAGTLARIVSYASSYAQVLTNFARAKTMLSSGGSGGGGGGAAGGGGGGETPAAPSFNIVGPSGANQIAESIAGKDTQPLKAFVVGGDVSTQQALNRGIVQNATLG